MRAALLRSLLVCLVFASCGVLPVLADPIAKADGIIRSAPPATKLVSQLGTCNSGAEGRSWTVTDGVDANDNTVGGGSNRHVAVCQQGAWISENPAAAGGVSDGDKQDVQVSGSGSNWQVKSGVIGAPEIATDGVGADEIAAGAVGTSEAAALDAADTTTGTFDDARIPAGVARDAESPAAGDITGSVSAGYQVGADAIGAPEIATGAVGTSEAAGLDAADVPTGVFPDAQVAATLSRDTEAVAAGDVSGSLSAGYQLGADSVGAAELATAAVVAGDVEQHEAALEIEDLGTACAINLIPKSDGAGGVNCAADSTGGAPTFDAVASGTNTTGTLVVGTGASLAPSGSGTITATAVSGTVTDGNVNGANESDEVTVGGDLSGTAANAQIGTGAVGTTEAAGLDTADVTTGTWADGRVAASNVEQHEGALEVEDLGTACANGLIPKSDGAGNVNCAVDSTGGTPTFDAVASGTNTASAMVVGTGSSLSTTGAGTIAATSANSALAVDGTSNNPDIRQVATGTCPSGWFRDIGAPPNGSFDAGTDKCVAPESVRYQRDYASLQAAWNSCPAGLGGADTDSCTVIQNEGTTQISGPVFIGDPEFSVSSNALNTGESVDGRMYGPALVCPAGRSFQTGGTEFQHGGCRIEATWARPTEALGVTVNLTDDGAGLTATLDCAACTFGAWGWQAGDVVEIQRATNAQNNNRFVVLSVNSPTQLTITDRETDGSANDIVTETGTGDEELWPYRPMLFFAGVRSVHLEGVYLDGDHNEDGSGANIGALFMGDNQGSGYPISFITGELTVNDIYGVEGRGYGFLATGLGGQPNDQVDASELIFNGTNVTTCGKIDSSQILEFEVKGPGQCVYDVIGFDLRDGGSAVRGLNIIPSGSATVPEAGILVSGSDQDVDTEVYDNEFEVLSGDAIVYESADRIGVTANLENNRIAIQGDPDAVSATTAAPELGTSTAATRLTLTDGTKAWSVNQWAGHIVFANGQYRRIASNTATALTVTRGWEGSNPSADAYWIFKNYGVRLSGSRVFTFSKNLLQVDNAGHGFDVEFNGSESANRALVFGTGNSKTTGVVAWINDQSKFAGRWCDQVLDGVRILNSGSYTAYSSGGIAAVGCFDYELNSYRLIAPNSGSASGEAWFGTGGTITFREFMNSGRLKFTDSAGTTEYGSRSTSALAYKSFDDADAGVVAGRIDKNATGWFWDENNGGTVSGTEGYFTLGTAPKGTGSRCARFDANGLLVAASGDCASGDTGGGASSIILDTGDDGSNESTSLAEIATTNDNATNKVVTEPSADKSLFNLGVVWPGGTLGLWNADTATEPYVSYHPLTLDIVLNPALTSAQAASPTGTFQWRLRDSDGCWEIEGSSADASELALCVVNPTADTTWNVPNLSAGTYTFAALEGAQTFTGVKTFSAAPSLPSNSIDAIADISSSIREGSGTKLVTGTEGSDLFTIETQSSANTVRVLFSNPGAGATSFESEQHATDGGVIRALEGADDGANFFGFKVPNSGLALDREITLEDDANPIPDSAVGDGVDDDVPEAADLGAITAGNALTSSVTGTLDVAPGLGLRISSDTVGLDPTAALSGDHTLSANEAKFGASGLIFEGSTADAIETYVSVTDPTSADRVVTIPNAASTTIQPLTCSGTDKVSAVSAAGVVTCSADQTSAGSNDSIRVEDSDDAGTYTAATDADFGDSGDINFELNTTPSPDEITATVRANAVALTTDTTGNYVIDVAAGNGVAVTGAAGEGATKTVALDYTDAGTDPSLGAGEARFSNEGASASGVVFEGDTADANETRLRVTDPTAERAVTIPDASGAVVLDSATQTLTEKTFNAESSGNVLTIPVPIQLDAAGCNNATAASFWDLPTSNAAVPACRTGTNVQGGTLDFADGQNLTAQRWIRLPTGWTGNIDAVVDWQSSTTSGDVVWQIAIACSGDGDSDDPAFTDDLFTADTTKGSANQANDTASNTVTTTGSCAAGDRARIRIRRDSGDAGDTMAGTARLFGVHLTIRTAL